MGQQLVPDFMWGRDNGIPPSAGEHAAHWMWRAILHEGRDGTPYCRDNVDFLRDFRRMWRGLHREEAQHGDPYHPANQAVLEEFRRRWPRPDPPNVANYSDIIYMFVLWDARSRPVPRQAS